MSSEPSEHMATEDAMMDELPPTTNTMPEFKLMLKASSSDVQKKSMSSSKSSSKKRTDSDTVENVFDLTPTRRTRPEKI